MKRQPYTQAPPNGTVVDWSDPITRGLRGAFPLNGTFKSGLGNSHNLIAGATAGPTFVGSHRGTVANFVSASSQTLTEAANEERLNFQTPGVTLSVSFNLTSLATNKVIIRKANATDHFILIINADGSINFYIQTTVINYWLGTSAGDISTNQWYHVVCTYDGAFMRVYLDGVEKGTPTAATGNLASDTASFYIGSGNDVDRYVDGQISNVLIWDRALAAKERQRLVENEWCVYKRPARVALADVPENVKWAATKLPSRNKIDWTNPLTKGLKFFGSFHEGFPFEYVKREHGIPGSAWRGMDPVDGVNAMTINDLDGKNNAVEFPKHDEIYAGISECTIMCFTRNRSSTVSAGQRPYGHMGTGSDPFYLTVDNTGNITVVLLTTVASYNSTGAQYTLDGVDIDRWALWGATWKNDALTGRWQNRKDTSPTTTSGVMAAPDVNADNVPRVGFANVGGTNSWNGWVAFAAFWDRALSDGEWNSMVDNPWQVFKSRDIQLPFNEDLRDLGTFELPAEDMPK